MITLDLIKIAYEYLSLCEKCYQSKGSTVCRGFSYDEITVPKWKGFSMITVEFKTGDAVIR